jgi:N-acetyl-gamma-glutamyl-phosphate reductase
MTRTVGLVGARGYVGQELVKLLDHHPSLRLGFVASRSVAGQPLSAHIKGTASNLSFEDLTPAQAAQRPVDAYVLALGNGEAAPYVEAIHNSRPDAVMVDVSADQRFNDAWAYGLPELFRQKIASSRRIANPGCYATGAQVALAPWKELLASPPSVFGVSGYSGAGSTPSPRNNPEALADNLMPYALTGHMHEREVTRHLGTPVFFMPHVAPFFRGMVLTVSMQLTRAVTVEDVEERYMEAYGNEPLIRMGREAPLPRDAVGKHGVFLGGFSVDTAQRHVVVVAALDNLLKGAASQALQNVNLALGLPELTGIPS